MNLILMQEHFTGLHDNYPGLQLKQDTAGTWFVQGMLHFIATYKGQIIEDDYKVEIIIPNDYPDAYPAVLETGGRIPASYHHYMNGTLCLGAPSGVSLKYSQEPTLLGFVKNCLIPYLYRYSYKEKHKGAVPFPELRHDWPGILQYYQGLLNIDDRKAILGLLKILAENKFQAHSKCPCGSRKRLRDCHGNIIRKLQRVRLTAEYQNEYNQLVKGIVNETKFRY